MSMSLYPHNAEAYEAATDMLFDTGKAAIIHPTGTGKSFIGFKLCEDHPLETICWLSPSEYIFRTQLDNLAEASGGWRPDNIVFYTYAKLMQMSSAELGEIRPDYIILDEFHRCGAKMWGEGVQRLLGMYPDAPLLGLTATNIRYLDNQRDMADELFDGNIASETSLGEAIVRGILDPPKYVLALFQYRNQLEKYQSRVQQARNKASRDKGEELLEALRRALDKAEGLDEIFARHMTERDGKYLVFCANAEHMRDMCSKVSEWFWRVDTEPHVYTAYSEDPETDQAFAAFKSDESNHLKLLFCIDMLNEGVHVDDVDGVILLRPTVSPIIYKQQIGRAMSAGKTKKAVIFDIVLNIENLYSIGAIEDEMQIATAYYRSLGLDNEIVNEHFKIIDEVRDCRILFDKLNDVLSAPWNLMYQEAKKYREQNDDLEVPRRYVTASGYPLGNWISVQRRVRNSRGARMLSDEQIRLLDDIGMRWESVTDLSWERYFSAAIEYYEQNGNLIIPHDHKTQDGLRLGLWISNMRMNRKSGVNSKYLTEERIRLLDDIGMQWDVLDYLFERNYAAAAEYHRQYGNLDVPKDYISKNGVRLGLWISSLRTQYREHTLRFSQDQIRRLDSIDMLWGGKYQADWEKAYIEAEQYKREHGNLDIPARFVTKSGMRLGRWIRTQREAWERGSLTKERKDKLDELGMVWDTDPWADRFTLLERYYREHGDLKIPGRYVINGVWLYRWLNAQVKRLHGEGKPLTEKQKQKLTALLELKV